MAARNSNHSKAMKSLAKLAIEGDYGQVRQLATKELVKARDEGGRTVLMLAADVDWTPEQFGKCTEYLLHLGADASAADAAGDTAAHLAARRDHLRLLALLPFEAKFLANNERLTPLMEAVQNQRWKCAIHLLYLFRQFRHYEKKAKLLGMENSKGQTVLQIARTSGQTELASIIERELQLVVDPYISGLSPSEEAARKELERLARAGDLAGLLRVATRVNCDLPDWEGLTALGWAARNGCDDAERLQHLAALADATCADVGTVSCLHGAAWSGGAVAVRVLVAAGAPVNARGGDDDRTPLMLAAWCEPPARAAATAQALLTAGADWSLRNGRGRTALDLATAKGRSEVTDLLRGYDGKEFFDDPLTLACSRHSLRCQAAESVARLRLPTDQLPRSLVEFVRLHRFGQDGCSG